MPGHSQNRHAQNESIDELIIETTLLRCNIFVHRNNSRRTQLGLAVGDQSSARR